MDNLSLNYALLMASLKSPLAPKVLGTALLAALANRYEADHRNVALIQFEQFGSTYLFDLASSACLSQEDRTVAAWALAPLVVNEWDTGYLRGFPMSHGSNDAPVDRGHVIPHHLGGVSGPNIYRQARSLNRGWSAQGRRYRALEREAAKTPGTFFFGHLIYIDDTAYPSEIEVGFLRGAALHVERFDNRPLNE
jgi:hypothetical protein